MTHDSTTTHRVLSIRQPYASLILAGRKWCENRTWQTRHRGPLLIHASQTIDRDAVEDLADELTAASLTADTLPTGAIIGVAWLADCRTELEIYRCFHDPDDPDSTPENVPADSRLMRMAMFRQLAAVPESADYVCGPECWIFSQYHQFADPIPAAGKLNLWRYDLPDGMIPASWIESAEREIQHAETTDDLFSPVPAG